MSQILTGARSGLSSAGDWVRDRFRPVGRVLDKKPVKYPLRTVLVLLLFALPIINLPIITTTASDFSGVLYTVTAYALVALGLNIVIGYAGLLDLGYVGFYAVGAYTVGVLTIEHGNWPFFFVLPIAIGVTALSGVILGAPTLRVRGDYLAIVTMGFGEIIRIVARNTPWLGGSGGIAGIPSPPDIGPDKEGLFQIPHLTWRNGYPQFDGQSTGFLDFSVIDAAPFYWLILIALIVVFFADRLIKNSRVGRAWEATREDEDAAEIMGVPTFKFKLLAFALGASIGGLAGAIFATRQGFINPPSFPLLLSMLFVAAVVIGGAGNRWGAIAGGVIVAYLPERFREFADWRLLVFGLALIIIVSFRPEGLFPGKAKRRAKEAEVEAEKLEEGVVENA